jgi:type I restriction enzyme S subunit
LTEEWRTYRIEYKKITAEQAMTDGEFPESWEMRPLKTIAARIEQGWSPKCESVPASYDEWAVIKTTAIQPIIFEPSENKKLPTTLLPRPELTINKGDILITRAGPRSRAAVCCYVRTTHSKLMICDKAYRFRATEEEFSGLLLCYFLNSPQYVRTLDSLKTGISESGVNLTIRKFQELELPMPPREEQTEIVRRTEELFAFADQLEAKVASAKSRIDRLTQSILAKAFRGELVSQDPNDEPASVLLERIKVQRTAAPKAKGSRQVTKLPS